MASDRKYTLAVIGCGTMASAVLISLLKSDTSSLPLSSIILCTRTTGSLDKLKIKFSSLESQVPISYSNDNVSSASQADVIMLAHKPYSVNAVLIDKGMREALYGHSSGTTTDNDKDTGGNGRKLIISILAGVSESQILDAIASLDQTPSRSDHEHVPREPYILRVCPNVGAQVTQSMTAILEPSASSSIPQSYIDLTTNLFSRVGKVVVLPSVQFEVATVLVGAAIAFTSVAVEGMLDGAVAQGVPRQTALEMVSQCLVGMGTMLGVEPGKQEKRAGKRFILLSSVSLYRHLEDALSRVYSKLRDAVYEVQWQMQWSTQ